MENMFEYAVRNKMRFNFRGVISVEDLWDLKVEDLDKLYKSLNAEAKQSQEDSLLDKKTKQEEELGIKIDLVKHIVEVKLDEQEQRRVNAENREKRKRIQELLAEKQDESLRNKSEDELKAMLDDMNK